jgi:FdrA protein
MLVVQRRPHAYHDSVVLMQISQRVSKTAGVDAAMVAMGTPLNLAILRETGLWSSELATATPEDLVIAIRGEGAETAIRAAEALLAERPEPSTEEVWQPRTIASAVKGCPGANLAVVSVPGEHAAWACWDALRADLNVFCFSSDVSVADEILLKDEALRRHLLFMGPDCGTAIVDGVGLGFSNVVPRGRIGVVGASGTGIQQLTCLLAHQGAGISHALGVGGRDLSSAVAGRMTREAIRRLDDDPETDVIVVVSKPAAADLRARKPLVKALLAPGVDLTTIALTVGGGDLPGDPRPPDWTGPVVGIFSGGTLKEEAALVWDGDPRFSAVDYGAEKYTRGRPHPIIDNTVRLEAIRRAEGLIYLDVILGRGAHPDPASELAPALRGPAVVVLVGTREDPQGWERQREAFEAAGATVYLSNSRAANALRR